MNWIDRLFATYIRRILSIPDIIVRAENAKPMEGHYVIVDVSQNMAYSEGHPVLPTYPDTPETYPTLGGAMDQVVRLNDIHNLNAESIKIFRLAEVDLSQMYQEAQGVKEPANG